MFLQGQPSGTHKDVLPKALWSVSNVRSLVLLNSEWFLQYLTASEILHLCFPPRKGQWGCLRRRLASQSNPFPFQQPAVEDKRSTFLSSRLVLCNGMLAWACSEVRRPYPTKMFM